MIDRPPRTGVGPGQRGAGWDLLVSPERLDHRDRHRGEALPTDSDPRSAAVRADRAVIERAAATLRSTTAQDVYAGLAFPAKAYAFALMLNELRLHAGDLDDELRAAVISACADISRPR